MAIKMKNETELLALSRAFIAETDKTKRLELKLILIQEKMTEIRDAWNKYNDDSLKEALDELDLFFRDDSNGLKFHTGIARKSYKGDWSSD